VSAEFDYPVTLPLVRNLFSGGSITLTSSSLLRME